MDKSQIIHEIAIISAKAYCDSNMPEYKISGIEGFAADMVKSYLKASESAKQAWDEYKPKTDSVRVLK